MSSVEPPRPDRRGAGGDALPPVIFDAGMEDADRAATAIASAASSDQRRGDRADARHDEGQRGERRSPHNAASAATWHISHGNRSAEILRSQRAGQQRERAAAARSSARRAAINRLRGRRRVRSALLGRAATCGRRRPAARSSSAHNRAGNPRCPCFFSCSAVAAKRGSVLGVFLEHGVVGLDLVDQMAAQIVLAEHRAILVIGIGNLRHRDVGLDAAFLHRAARRRVIARGGQPQRGVVGRAGAASAPIPCRSCARP